MTRGHAGENKTSPTVGGVRSTDRRSERRVEEEEVEEGEEGRSKLSLSLVPDPICNNSYSDGLRV